MGCTKLRRALGHPNAADLMVEAYVGGARLTPASRRTQLDAAWLGGGHRGDQHVGPSADAARRSRCACPTSA
jgi:hypothetical protein